MGKGMFILVLATVVLGCVNLAEAQHADLWDPDRPDPTVTFEETKALAQAIKTLLDENEIQWSGFDDFDIRNRLKFDTVPALEGSRHTRSLAFWTSVLALLTGLYVLVMQLKRRLISSTPKK